MIPSGCPHDVTIELPAYWDEASSDPDRRDHLNANPGHKIHQDEVLSLGDPGDPWAPMVQMGVHSGVIPLQGEVTDDDAREMIDGLLETARNGPDAETRAIIYRHMDRVGQGSEAIGNPAFVAEAPIMIEGREVAGGAVATLLAMGRFDEDIEGLDGRGYLLFNSMSVLFDRGCLLMVSLTIPAEGLSYEAVAEDLLALRVVPASP